MIKIDLDNGIHSLSMDKLAFGTVFSTMPTRKAIFF